MTTTNKNPGSALPRAAGAELDIHLEGNIQCGTYDIFGDLQRRHLMRRCGIGSRQATLVAALCFGEGGR